MNERLIFLLFFGNLNKHAYPTEGKSPSNRMDLMGFYKECCSHMNEGLHFLNV